MCFLTSTSADGETHQLAYARWYADAATDEMTDAMRAVQMHHLQWARMRLPAADGQGQTMADWNDVFPLSDIQRPVFILFKPTTRNKTSEKNYRFFINPFVC